MTDSPLQRIRELLESFWWPETIDPMTRYERFEDDSPTGTLSVVFSGDGDGWIDILCKPDPDQFGSSMRFRTQMTGGGQSPRARNALLILAEAIRLDNEDHPQHRILTNPAKNPKL